MYRAFTLSRMDIKSFEQAPKLYTVDITITKKQCLWSYWEIVALQNFEGIPCLVSTIW